MNADTDTTKRWSNIEVDDTVAPKAEAQPEAPSAPAPAPAVIRPTPVAVPTFNTDGIPYSRNSQQGYAPQAPKSAKEIAAETRAEEIVKDANRIVATSVATESTGAVVYWSLSGSVNVQGLAEAWVNEGLDLDLLPSVPSAKVALYRAVKAQASKHRLVRQHPEGGWVLVDETSDGKDLDYNVGLRIFASANGETVDFIKPDNVSDADAQAVIQAVEVEYARIMTEISHIDTSAWLVDFASRVLQGVALRERGGLYFVPKAGIALLRRVKKAVEAASKHVVYEIPAMHSVEAIGAVLDAMRRETAETVTELDAELNTGEVGARGNASRIRRCEDLAAKIAGYEQLLGTKLGDALESVLELKKRIEEKTSRFNLLEVD